MKIVTAANAAFKPILDATLPVNSSFYPVEVYDIGGLGKGTPFAVGEVDGRTHERKQGKCPYKPRVILDALSRSDETVAWLDADAWVIRPMPEIDFGNFDVAVTMRRQKDRGHSNWPDVYGYLQAGVVFVNPTESGIQFVQEWIDEVPMTASNSDQHALNNLVRQVTDCSEYDKVFYLKGCRIKVLDGEIYNWCYLPQDPMPATKILHCKTDIRSVASIEEWTKRRWT